MLRSTTELLGMHVFELVRPLIHENDVDSTRNGSPIRISVWVESLNASEAVSLTPSFVEKRQCCSRKSDRVVTAGGTITSPHLKAYREK